MVTKFAFSLRTCAIAALISVPSMGAAQLALSDMSEVVSVELIPGWPQENGQHIAALRFSLAPGWKTYWRSPGDGGLPTLMDWSGSENLSSVEVLWPHPLVFRQDGLRSIGYEGDVVLPLAVTPNQPGDVQLSAELNFGICKEVCLPVQVALDTRVTEDHRENMPEIIAAMETQAVPMATQAECGLRQDGSKTLLDVALTGGIPNDVAHTVVLEPSNRELWVGEPQVQLEGSSLYATSVLASPNGGQVDVDLEALRITLLTDTDAVETIGCAPKS